MQTPPGELILRQRRVIPAIRARVFRAFVEPLELGKWWGPQGFTAPSVELDVREGGAYRIGMQPPEGDLFYLVGEYLAVTPPSLLSYTFRWEPPDADDVETVVTVALEDLGEDTEVTVVQGSFKTEDRLALHEGGWKDSLDRLHELLAASQT